MHYRFLWDEEPADEQFQVIMQEVGEEARCQDEEIKKWLKEDVEREYLRFLSTYPRSHDEKI